MATRINIHGKDISACGYHENEKGKKFIKIVATLDYVCVKVKLQKGKTLHLIADEPHFKYSFIGDFVQFTISFREMQEWCMHAEIDKQLNKVWFE